jgi:Fe-S-cluster containining protein
MIVTLTGRGLTVLSQNLGLSSKDLLRAVDFYILRKDEQAPIGLRNLPSILTERGMAYIALKKMDEGSCIFLKDNLCMIHSYRPAVCRSFPFVFEMDDEGILWGLSALKDICPGLGNGSEVTVRELEELGISVMEDLEIYKEFVEEWNHDQEHPTTMSLLEMILQDSRFII